MMKNKNETEAKFFATYLKAFSSIFFITLYKMDDTQTD